MKTLLPSLLALFCAAVAVAQEEAPKEVLIAPPVEVQDSSRRAVEAPEKEAVEEASAALPRPSMLEEKTPDAAPEPTAAVEPAPEPEAAPAPKPAPVTKPAPKAASAPARPGAPEEFSFAKAAAEDADGNIQRASMDELALFIRRYPASDQAPEAMLLLAGLKQKEGDWKPATTSLLRLLYEFPDTKIGLRAKSDYLTLVDKKASRKHRPILSGLVRIPENPDTADRLSALWQMIAEQAPEALYEPVAEEIRDLSVRFPGHKDGDRLQAALARLHAANDKPAAALLAWRKLLALFPVSPARARAQMAIGDLYADALRDPKKAIDAYQELVDKYPQAPEVLPALENSARLFDDKLRQYALAVEMHEKVAALFPKTPASLKALTAIAKLQRDRLHASEDAVKTLMRLSSMHGGQEGIDALRQAAEYARRDLKDYPRQAELLRKVSSDYADAREAPQALYDAAGVYEDSIKDSAKAIELYREVSSKFPSHKLAKRAEGRIVKLEGK